MYNQSHENQLSYFIFSFKKNEEFTLVNMNFA